MKQLTSDEKGFILWLITEYKKQHSTNDDMCNSISKKLYTPETVVGMRDGVMSNITLEEIEENNIHNLKIINNK